MEAPYGAGRNSSTNQEALTYTPTPRYGEARGATSNVGWSWDKRTKRWPIFPVAPRTATGTLLTATPFPRSPFVFDGQDGENLSPPTRWRSPTRPTSPGSDDE